MPFPLKEPLLHDRKQGEASEISQQWCGEQKISQLAELALVSPLAGSSGTLCGPAAPRHAILASEASQPSQPLCPWRQITKQNNVENINTSTVLHFGFLKTSGLCCGVMQRTVSDLGSEVHACSFKEKKWGFGVFFFLEAFCSLPTPLPCFYLIGV